MKKYQDKTLSPEVRAKALLEELTDDEKLDQLSAELIFYYPSDKWGEGKNQRRYKSGNVRCPGHFLHYDIEKECPIESSVEDVVAVINNDIQETINANRLGIPVLVNEEALHGIQWAMGTLFPQPIGLASMFDDELLTEVADVIGKETAAGGVKQVFAPNVNICRDSRWGRTIETFGEDVLLVSNCGAIMCNGFESNNVIATPKHFVDNYADGGRDSNDSHSSERELREVYLKPFEKCFKVGGAKSVMSAYNSINGVPCVCNKWLLTDVLRKEWGFDGFVVSDYGGVDNVFGNFAIYATPHEGEAACIKAGHDLTLPCGNQRLRDAYAKGIVSEKELDESVYRILVQKFRTGAFDSPFADPKAAAELLRCEKHKDVAYRSAKESMVLLKNKDNLLPLKKQNIKKLAVFGGSAKLVPVGENYSGPFRGWRVKEAKSCLDALKEYLDGTAEVIFGEEHEIEKLCAECDAALYFTSTVEGEGLDRCSLKLPSVTKVVQSDDSAIIVDKREISVEENQEESILRMTKANPNSCVILINGAPVDMSAWEEKTSAILEAWYPGEQGARALAELLFGEYSPSGKLPISIPKESGQMPFFYSHKASGRAYHYSTNDGNPLYFFGYGLSYTSFNVENCKLEMSEDGLSVTGTIENTGDMDGCEVLQVYIRGKNCGVSRPLKELKGYKRVNVKKGCTETFSVVLDKEAFYFYDADMKYGVHDSDYAIMIGTSCNNIINSFEITVKNEKIQL